MKKNFQHELDGGPVGPAGPRVHITYDVETEGAIAMEMLPFIVGVMGDFSGKTEGRAPLAQRSFVEISKDNFNDVMMRFAPTVSVAVPDRIKDDGSRMAVDLTIEKLDDLTPAQVLRNIPDLAGEFRARTDMRNLLTKIDGREEVASFLGKLCHPDPNADADEDKDPAGTLRATFEAAEARVNGLAHRSAAVTGLRAQIHSLTGMIAETPDGDAKDKLQADLDAAQAKLDALLKDNQAKAAAAEAAAKEKADAAQAAVEGGDDSYPARVAAEHTAAALTRATARREAADWELTPVAAEPGARQKKPEDRTILEKLFAAGLARTPDQEGRAIEMLKTYLERVVDPDLAAQTHSEHGAAQRMVSELATLDKKLNEQLNLILHSPEFQEVESRWRQLWHLVSLTPTGLYLKIKVLDVTLDDLRKDMEKGGMFDWEQSELFKKVYESEFGTYGGHPFSMLVLDHYFGRSMPDQNMLEYLAHIASMAHAPMLSGAAPDLFDLESFTDLAKPRELASIFESLEAGIVAFSDFRNAEDSRYVSLTLPRFLLRAPYDPENNPADGFDFNEEVAGEAGPDNAKFLWGNAAFALAERITNAFALYYWPASFRGVEAGGMVENLPLYNFKTGDGDIAIKCPTEIALTDRREKELSDLGFIALCHEKNKRDAVFFGGQTINEPVAYDNPNATGNAKLSASLPYMLVASRFAHYIKEMLRKKIGSAMTEDNIRAYLSRWISNYVLEDDTASQTLKAARPLREARVDVYPVEGSPGVYTSTVYIRPHFQLEEIAVSIRLVVKMPPAGA